MTSHLPQSAEPTYDIIELTMVKGLTLNQIRITQELSQNIGDVQQRLTPIEEQLTMILTLLKPSWTLQ
jgi:hypothetical protein